MPRPDFHIREHRLLDTAQILSPNCSMRSLPMELSLLVLHCISLPPGEFGGGHIKGLFLNQLCIAEHPCFAELVDLQVSAHVLIRRDGVVEQYVPFDQAAWHAGESAFQGRPACNEYSIGIELEGAEDIPFTDPQYECLINLSRCLLREYPTLCPERVVGHADIAPGRKTDPGEAFDWERYRTALSVI